MVQEKKVEMYLMIFIKIRKKKNVYTMVEVWKDEAAVASHNTSEHFTSFVSKASQFLTAPLNIKAYNGELVE